MRPRPGDWTPPDTSTTAPCCSSFVNPDEWSYVTHSFCPLVQHTDNAFFSYHLKDDLATLYGFNFCSFLCPADILRYLPAKRRGATNA